VEQKIRVKLVDAYHKNLIFFIPTREGQKKLKIRQIEDIKYLKLLKEYLEKNGKKYSKWVHSIYNGKLYLNDIYEAELSKEDLLKLLTVPRRKAEKYEELMKILREV